MSSSLNFFPSPSFDRHSYVHLGRLELPSAFDKRCTFPITSCPISRIPTDFPTGISSHHNGAAVDLRGPRLPTSLCLCTDANARIYTPSLEPNFDVMHCTVWNQRPDDPPNRESSVNFDLFIGEILKPLHENTLSH